MSETPSEPRPNPVYAFALTVVGLLVPLPILRLIRGRLSGPKAGRGWTPVIVFVLAAWWLMALAGQAAAWAFLGIPTFAPGSPPKFDHPPNLSALNFMTVFGVVWRGLMGVVQLQLGMTLFT